jgi:multicomponent Na+:H+ antiporter subunit D
VNGLDFLWRHADALLLLAPLLAGILLTVAPAGRAANIFAALIATASAALALTLVVRMLAGAPPSSIDALGVGAVAVGAVAAAATFLAALSLAPEDYPRRTRAIALGLGLVVVGASLGAMIEHDALRIVLLLQTAMLAGAALTGLAATQDRRAALSAFNAVIITLGAGALALSGAALVFAATGAMDITQVAVRVALPGSDSGAWLGAALMIAGLAAFAGLAPFHAGAAASAARTAHATAPLISILLRLAAFVALVRVYGATQSIAMPGVAQSFAYGVAALGAVGVLAGGLQAIGASEARRLAAHALTAQFGCALIGLAAGGDDGAIAALFVAAAGTMTALALVIGAAVARAGTTSSPMATLDGLGRSHPLVAAAITVAALGMTGAPLTASFLGKWLSIEAALARGWYWAAAAIVASSFAAVFVAGQIVERLYFRKRADVFGTAPRTAYVFAPALAAAVLATLVFGWDATEPLDAARMAASALSAPGRAAP